jgi:hypothetical protein
MIVAAKSPMARILVLLFVAMSPERLKGSKSVADAAVRDLRKRRREDMGLRVVDLLIC